MYNIRSKNSSPAPKNSDDINDVFQIEVYDEFGLNNEVKSPAELPESFEDPLAEPRTTGIEERAIDLPSTSSGQNNKRPRPDGDCHQFIQMKNKQTDQFENFTKPPEHEQDDLTAFFKSMEIATRKLPLALQIRVKRAISKEVWDAEEENDNNYTVQM